MKFDVTTLLSQFNNQTAPVRYGVFAAVLVVILLIDIFTVMNLQLGLLKNTRERKNTLMADINRVNTDKQRIDQMRKGAEGSRQQLVQLNQRMRSLNDMPIILEDVYRIAAETGFKIDQLTPLRDKQEKLKGGPEGGDFYALPILMEARGRFHTFGKFLNRLENNNFLFTITYLSMESDPKASGDIIVKSTIKVILMESHEQVSK